MIKLSLRLFVCICLISPALRAQIELNIFDYHRFDNQYFRGFMYTNFDQVTMTPPGPDQFWDYFLLDDEFRDTLTVVKADLTPFSNAFPEAEFALTTNNYSFFYESLSQEGVKIEGRAVYDPIYDVQIVTPFQTSGFSLPYPVNYQDQYNFEYSYVARAASFLPGVDSSLAKSNVQVSINADAWGILTIPGGTFDVLRLRQTSFIRDSVYYYSSGGNWTFDDIQFDTTVTDFFYTKNIGASLLTIRERPGIGITNVNFLKGFFINSTESVLQPKLTCFPQPASTSLFIDSEKPYRTELTDLQGRVLFTYVLQSGVQQLPIPQMEAGIYLLRCFEPNGEWAGVQKIILGAGN